MVEGYLFVLFGIIFLFTIIRYSTNMRFTYFLIPFALIPWYRGMIFVGNTTPIVALAVSIVIYLFLSKRFKFAWVALLLGLSGVILKWSWLCMKFRCRPYVWGQLLINTFYHPIRKDALNIIDPGVGYSPWFEKALSSIFGTNLPNIKPWLVGVFGGGFSQFLNSDYTWVDFHKYGWVHLQNDYLHAAMCLGPVALIFLVWFVISSLKTIGRRPIIILFMFVALVCFAQLTMFDPGKAGICLMIMALCITDGIRRNE